MWVRSTVSAIALLAAATGIAHAQDTDQSQDKPQTVVVTGARIRSLEQFTPTGSRLGLSTRETPAAIDVIASGQMEARGYASVEQAADSLPGVTSGGSPGDPSSFAMRGFEGDQISVLHNGLYIGPSDMTNRPENTFNLQSVEILKGPASVLYGQGAIGGVVNVTNKAPSFGDPTYDFMASVGSFGTTNFGLGGSTKLSSNIAIRADVSRTSTDGYVHNSPADSTNATVSLVWKVTDDFRVQFMVDYLTDDPSKYFGTPLVPDSFATDPLKGVLSTSFGYTLDSRMRYVNYNVADAHINSTQWWPQVFEKWTPTENITIENFTYFLSARRNWFDSETYTFDTATNLIDRDRFYVIHHQSMFGDQASIKFNNKFGTLDNTFIVGLDYSHLDFDRYRGFPNGDSVDPFNPSPGLFGPLLQPGETVERSSPTKWDDTAVFFEDSLSVTPQLKLVTGGRLEALALTRQNFDANGNQLDNGFSRTYSPFNFRVGAVYDVTPDITPYISFNTAADPVGDNVFLVNSNEDFNLSHSQQVEVGVKASTPDKRGDLTVSLYDISRKNFLIDNSPDTVATATENSKGLELSGDYKITEFWSITANAAYTDAKYADTGSSYPGDRPADIPKTNANLWSTWSHVGGIPLELGAGLKYVGDRYADNANTVKLDPYTLVSLYASYDLTPKLTVALHVDNALDKAYAQWGDVFYPSEVMLGAPRSFTLNLIGHF